MQKNVFNVIFFQQKKYLPPSQNNVVLLPLNMEDQIPYLIRLLLMVEFICISDMLP